MKRTLIPCALILLALLCLAALLATWAFTTLPEQAEQAFGPPASEIDTFEVLYLSARLLPQQESLKRPNDPWGTPRPFRIQSGESTRSITDRLQSEGLVADAGALRTYLQYRGLDTTLQAGEYSLSGRMTPLEIAHALQDATPGEVTFSILPGWRMEEIAAALPTSGLSFTPQAFLAIAARPSPGLPLVAELPPGATLEGFLFPDSYRMARETSLEAFLKTALADFQLKVTIDLRQGFQQQGLNLYQAVTLASIVQREAIVEDEMPLIASVFLNRLAAGMKLDTDPTVQYALGYNVAQNTWWTNPLSLDDLQFDSPYNTYLYPGLPPTPIANPSLNALQAVAFPAQTPYYYFRAACDHSGLHNFAQTYEEHQQYECP